MLAFLEIQISLAGLFIIVLGSASLGFLVNYARIKKQKSSIVKLEAEMLQNHAEILQLQKELSDKESKSSQTPIFSIAENGSESAKEQTPGPRLTKKVSGGGKSTS